MSIGCAWMMASPTPAASRTSSHVSETMEPTAAAVRMPRTNAMPSSATHRNSSASSEHDERRPVDVAQDRAHQRIRLRDALDDACAETVHDRDDQQDDDGHGQRAEP